MIRMSLKLRGSSWKGATRNLTHLLSLLEQQRFRNIWRLDICLFASDSIFLTHFDVSTAKNMVMDQTTAEAQLLAGSAVLRTIQILLVRKRTPHCVNCKGDHAASDRNCPKFLEQKKIIRIKFTERITFPEAKRKFEASIKSQSYTSVTVPKNLICNRPHPDSTTLQLRELHDSMAVLHRGSANWRWREGDCAFCHFTKFTRGDHLHSSFYVLRWTFLRFRSPDGYNLSSRIAKISCSELYTKRENPVGRWRH